eukprot:TRINITY_DN6929_c0_g1_i3.p1 TRINITY_DN6929_c0_g1~~TRINITY_DN6929_c0_g1_i3.p1  ORF type:complete len:427 (+),score=103.42 TRINITY_DN6929_c0_g1_i3:165-1283(+)
MEALESWFLVSCVVTWAMMIPCSVLLYISEPIMRLLQQPEEVQPLTGMFTQYLIPGLWFLPPFFILQKYLQAQNVMHPPVIVAALANLFNALGNYLLIYTFDMGLKGAPIATSLSRLFQLLVLAYFAFSHRKKVYNKPWPAASSSLTFVNLKKFLKYGLPGGVTLGLEAWSFEIVTLLAGIFGSVALDAHSTLLSVCAFIFFSFPVGVGIAASIRCGNLLGANLNKRARLTSAIALVAVTLFMTTTGIIFLLTRDYIGKMFSSDSEVIRVTAKLAPLAAAFQITDGLQGVCGAINRGLGRQALVAKLTFSAFWILGIPLGCVLAFVADLEVFGLWWGLVIGLFLLSLFHLVYLYRTDWDALESSHATVTAGH